jgi:pyrroline-5-carboxylate reductase
MGGAILTGVLASTSGRGKDGSSDLITKFIATVHTEASAEKLKAKYADHGKRLTVIHGDNLPAFQDADVILLACKPYMARKVLGAEGVQQALRNKIVISVLAGATNETLWSYIGSGSEPSCSIVRAMPNVAAQVGESMTVISSSQSSTPKGLDVTVTEWIFKKVGRIQYVGEDVFHVASAVAGTTGAFFTIAFDGILDGAVAEGLKRAEARDILAQSLLGMAKMIQDGEHPAVLREMVSSPRGTTIQGIMRLEKAGARSAYTEAVIDAVSRGKRMGN